MFQYSALKGIARNRNFDFCIPNSNGNNEWEHHQLFNCFDINPFVGVIGSNYVQESGF